jgi:serine protease
VCTPDIPPVDATAPVILSETITPTTVDVSSSAQPVTITVHLTDNIGVTEVRGFGYGLTPADSSPSTQAYGTLTSGTMQDGIWALKFIAAKGTAAGFGNLTLVANDAVPNYGTKQFAGVTVVDTDPDTTAPVVSALSFSSTQPDVRNAAVTLTVTAHITDDDTGVDSSSLPWVYLIPPASSDASSTPARLYSFWQRVSGTDQDGMYQLVFTLPQGTIGGAWTLTSSNVIQDRAGNTVWVPDATVDVISSPPLAPPTVVTATVDEPKIDVCPTGATEQIDLHVQGADTAAQIEVYIAGPYDTYDSPAGLISGTPADGIWRVSIPFMSTTPPGVYNLSKATVTDRGETTTETLSGSFTIVPAGSPTS